MLSSREMAPHSVKLIDFGLAQIITPGSEYKNMHGTPEFVGMRLIKLPFNARARLIFQRAGI